MSKSPTTTSSASADGFPTPAKGDVIVYGAPERGGGGQAGWFPANEADAAVRTGALLKLASRSVSTDELAFLAARLPAGELTGVARRFAPIVSPAAFAALSSAPWSTAPKLEPKPVKGPATNWADLQPGHVVLCPEETSDEGWWQAVIVRRVGDMATLRWRFDPDMAAFMKPVGKLGLIQSSQLGG